jgi:hypothetical protein
VRNKGIGPIYLKIYVVERSDKLNIQVPMYIGRCLGFHLPMYIASFYEEIKTK